MKRAHVTWHALAWFCLCPTVLVGGPLALQPVAEGIYVYTGPHEEAASRNLGAVGNAAIVVGDTAAALVDTGGSLAFGNRLRAGIEALIDVPVRYVINTHAHPDHVFGNGAFDDPDVQFVGHRRLARALATRAPFYIEAARRLLGPDFAGTRVIAPDVLVHDELDIDLGNRLLRLTAHETAHTDNDLTVLDMRTRTLLAGDLVFVDRVPVVDGSLKGWLRVGAKLRGLPADRVVPGHGPASVPWPDALDAQERYLHVLLRDVRREIAGGGTIGSAVRRAGASERGRWRLFDEVHPRNVTASFTELEWE